MYNPTALRWRDQPRTPAKRSAAGRPAHLHTTPAPRGGPRRVGDGPSFGTGRIFAHDSLPERLRARRIGKPESLGKCHWTSPSSARTSCVNIDAAISERPAAFLVARDVTPDTTSPREGGGSAAVTSTRVGIEPSPARGKLGIGMENPRLKRPGRHRLLRPRPMPEVRRDMPLAAKPESSDGSEIPEPTRSVLRASAILVVVASRAIGTSVGSNRMRTVMSLRRERLSCSG